MKRRNIFLTAVSALAAGMILTATAGSAWAYFTTYTSASGGYAVNLGNETEIVETYSEHTKHLTVTNEGTAPVYVRARAFSGSRYGLTYEGEGWQAGADGYYYYNSVVPGITSTEDGTVSKSQTSQLDIRIAFPEDAEEGDDCNVVVIYESMPVQYDADGNILGSQAADWSVQVVTGGMEGGIDG
ncbi:MAG: hypothetical protein HFH93_01075 [Lachnospiraceae bacterium]|nr:hypothetical protein [Lachnospiraceae bacterium]